MRTTPHPKDIVRWRVILPVIMVVVTVVLEIKSSYQSAMEWPRYRSTGFSTTADSISHILNLPVNLIQKCLGFYAPVSFGQITFELGLLVCAAIWWALVGWRLDTRHRSFGYSLDYKIGWTVIYLAGLYVCAGFMWFATHELRWMGLGQYAEFYRRYGLRSWSIASAIGACVWGLGFCSYLLSRIHRLWRRSPNRNSSSLRFNYVALEWMIALGLCAWLTMFVLRGRGIYIYANESLVITRSCIAGVLLELLWENARRRHVLTTDSSA
jgi:hypothetical protein